jgi:hypothetical protein
MSRSSGRRNPTRSSADPGPDSPLGREMGESERQDPGGWINTETGNVLNYETPRQPVTSPEPMDQFRGMMAHGVPHEEDTTEERALAERGGPNVRRGRKVPAEKPAELPPPVPVYIVERESGPRPLTVAGLYRLTVPAIGKDPVRVAGEDARRSLLQVMNEDSATNIRIGNLIDLSVDAQNNVVTGGARLPAGASGYTAIRTQGQLYAIAETGSAATISVILEFENPG